jgi:hypothetical protein
MICNKDGCEKPARSKGLCNTHYSTLWRKLNPGKKYEKTYRKDGPLCVEDACDKPAHAKKRCANHYIRFWKANNPDKRYKKGPKSEEQKEKDRAYARRVALKYGYKRTCFTPELEQKMLLQQDGKCAICSVPFNGERTATSRCRDHDHVEKRPRGILCRICNIALGYYEKCQRPAGLVIAPYEEYLERGKKH